MGMGLVRAMGVVVFVFLPACGDDDDSGPSGEDGGTDGGLPADGRLPGDDADSAVDAVDYWPLDHTTEFDLNPLLGDYPSSTSRAIAVVAEDATVGGVNSALDAAAVRIVGGVPGGTLFVEVAEPDFERLHEAVETLTASGAFEAVGEDLLLIGAIVPGDANPLGHWAWDRRPEGMNWHLEHVRAPAAWSLVKAWERESCSHRPSVLVGAIDDGMHPHPDLADVTWIPPDDGPEPDGKIRSHAMSIAAIMGAGSLAEADLRDDKIEGVNPWASVVGRSVPLPNIAAGALSLLDQWVFGDQEAIKAETSRLMDQVYALGHDNAGLRIINLSVSWPVGDPNHAFQLGAMGAGAAAARKNLRRLVYEEGRDLAIFQSANNGFGAPAQFSAPFGMAALTRSEPDDPIARQRVLVVEALGPVGLSADRGPPITVPPLPDDWNGWDVDRMNFSNVGGDVSAPGTKVGSPCAGCADGYYAPSGTSQATPVVAGIASLVAMVTDKTMADVVDHLRKPHVTIPAGSAAEEVDALNAILAIDGPEKSCGQWKRRLVDIDDGTQHGLRLFDARGGRNTSRDLPDRDVDMADFRAWRTAYDYYRSQVRLDHLPEDHPKLDLNENGLLRADEIDVENHARQDFNGDGKLDLDTQRDVLGVPKTDLDVLKDCFADTVEGWTAGDLRALADESADLVLRLQWVGPGVDRIRNQEGIFEPLTAIELEWPTNGPLARPPRRVAVDDRGRLPSEVIMTVPIPGGPLEVTAIVGEAASERRLDICATLGKSVEEDPLLFSEQRPFTIVVSCAEGETCCEDGCKDLDDDADNCDECGNACGGGWVCADGECVENPCSDDQRFCDGVCYDPGSVEVCEGCDSPCMAGQECCGWSCCDGWCSLDGEQIQCSVDSYWWCDGELVDISSDMRNCGTCGAECGAGEGCCGGGCINLADGIYEDLSGIPTHCGTCGNHCGLRESCCGGACVSNQTDENCGGCGPCNLADGDYCCHGTCYTWDEPCVDPCPDMCPEGFVCNPPGWWCIDLLSSPMSCGGVGNACDLRLFAPGGEYCINGQCTTVEDNDDAQNCGGTGSVCEEEYPDSPDCCDASCTNVDEDDEHCGACDSPIPQLPGLHCCGGAPIDTQWDRENCSQCGMACDEGFDCCDGDCADVREDDSNCGGCGVECEVLLPERAWDEISDDDPFPWAVPVCCEEQCVDMRYDHENCGACGVACGEEEICCLGACVDPESSERHCGDCHVECGPTRDDQCCSGTCTDVATDDANCGSCGSACTEPETCIDGGCACAL